MKLTKFIHHNVKCSTCGKTFSCEYTGKEDCGIDDRKNKNCVCPKCYRMKGCKFLSEKEKVVFT